MEQGDDKGVPWICACPIAHDFILVYLTLGQSTSNLGVFPLYILSFIH